MNTKPDLLVIGAGPAGTGAALAAADCGLKTTIIDSAATSGGQVYRAMPTDFNKDDNLAVDTDSETGARQRDELHSSRVQLAFNRTVWSVNRDLQVDTIGPHGIEHWQPERLLVATGAHERVIPFEGWTLPSVIGLAAATILLKSQLVLPGQRTLVAGCGPLLALVAHNIVKNGGEVVAVIDLSSRVDWLKATPALFARPDDLKRGLQWRLQLHKAGIPWLYRHSIRKVQTNNNQLEIDVGAVHSDGSSVHSQLRSFEADCVAVGHGLVPSTDITRLLGVDHHYRPDQGGWVPLLDECQRTSHQHFYAAGDGTGIHGAATAWLDGRIAGYTAALDSEFISPARHHDLTKEYRAAKRKTVRAGYAMAHQLRERSGLVASIAPETIVCRCEDITRTEIDQAVANGATDINQLKSWTRCCMGPCQGRMCGDTVAALISARSGTREEAGYLTSRVPIRPVDLSELTGDFDYHDIAIPKAAPL